MVLPVNERLFFGAWVLLVALYFAATLPYLERYPHADWTQMGVTPAPYSLAEDGVYGNAQFAGFHRIEERNYEFMPLYPLAVALFFLLFGSSVLSAKLVSVAAGLAIVVLTYRLARTAMGRWPSLLAAAMLCVVPTGSFDPGGGMLLVHLARTVRYDIFVPMFGLIGCLALLWAVRDREKNTAEQAPKAAGSPSRWGLLGAGALVGLATLSHLYGAFVLVVLVATLFVSHGKRAWKWTPLLGAGWALPLVPWGIYIAMDVAAYRGQMARHGGRFSVHELSFYLENVGGELDRYDRVLSAMIAGSIGTWVLVLSALAGAYMAFKSDKRGLRLVGIATFVLPVLLALTMTSKRYTYLILFLPFASIAAAYALSELAIRLREERAAFRWVVIACALFVVLEGGLGIWGVWQRGAAATAYPEIVAEVSEPMPAGSRVLVSQALWLGMADEYETRSIFGAFLLGELEGLEQVIDEFDPDFIVAEEHFLAPENEWMRESWDGLGEYLEHRCANRVSTIDDPTYGVLFVHDCRTP